MCNLKINELTQREKDESLNGMKEINKLEDREIEHKKRFQESMEGTIKTAKSYYETNRKINIIIVIVGLVFLANSILYAWFNNEKGTDNDWLSVVSGGLSIASFATLFFTKPQENITKAFGNLAQIQMIYKAHCLQFDAILDYHLRQENADIDLIKDMNTAIESATHNAVVLVQEHVENEEATRTNEKVEEILTDVKKAATTEKIHSL